MMCPEEAREFIDARNFESENSNKIRGNIANMPPGLIHIMSSDLKWSPSRMVKECGELNWNHDEISKVLKRKVDAKNKNVVKK